MVEPAQSALTRPLGSWGGKGHGDASRIGVWMLEGGCDMRDSPRQQPLDLRVDTHRVPIVDVLVAVATITQVAGKAITPR